MFYVYEWYIKDTNEVIYVGKGTGQRYKVRKHNRFFNDMIHRFQCESRIVKEFELESDAFDYEYVHINEMKKKGQCVCNIYNGGFGGTTEWWTDELRKKYSKNNVMKSESQRKRMSEHNPMKNKDVAEKTGKTKRKSVIIGNHEYGSIKEACEKYNTYSNTIISWCKKGVNIYGEKCHYKGMPQNEYKNKRYNKGGSKAVVFRNKHYECVKDFAKEIGISETTANQWLKRGFNSRGEKCRYENDNRDLVFLDRYVARNKAKAKSVIVNGIEYSSCEEASKKLKIPKSTLYSYLQGVKHNKAYICKYGNQHPSRVKSDNSNTEGSTTNR